MSKEAMKLQEIMEQAQVFASAWSIVGGRFDGGNAMDDAEDAKNELYQMVQEALANDTTQERVAETGGKVHEAVGEVEYIDIDEDGQPSAWVKLYDNVELGQLLYLHPPELAATERQVEILTDELAKLHSFWEEVALERSVKIAELEDELRLMKKQEQGEPVGEMQLSAIYEGAVVPVVPVELPVGTKLYTTPQQRKPLDCFETEKLAKQCGVEWTTRIDKLCKLAAAHGIKE